MLRAAFDSVNKPRASQTSADGSIYIWRHISLESRKPSFPARSGSRCRNSVLSHRMYSPWDHSVSMFSSPAPRKTLRASHQTDSLQHNQGDRERDGRRWWWRAVISCRRTLDNLAHVTPPPWGSSLQWLDLGAWRTSRGGKQGWWVDGS